MSAPPANPEKKSRPLFITTLITSAAILLCRFSGLIREAVFSGIFGQTGATDAFSTAFRIPNMLRDLLAEGALSQSFTSILAKTKKNLGDQAAWALVRKLGSQVFFLMLVIVILGIIFAEPIMSLMFHKKPESVPLATELNRIMWPFIGFISFAALVMGVLNVLGSFALPMLASCAFNIVSVIAGIALGWVFDPEFGPRSLLGFAIGVTLGGAAQWLVQCPSLRKAGFRFKWDFGWKDKSVKSVWSLMIPVALAAGATQINVFINMQFANELVDGSATIIQTAFRVWQLPVGLFGVATGMIVLPDIARLSSTGSTREIIDKLSQALRQILFFAIPSFVILFLLSSEVVSVLFQRGKFLAQNSLLTGETLQVYALGLLGYAGIKVIQPVFVAMEKKWVPLHIALVSFGINYAMNYTFVRILHKDVSWLALTTSVVTTLNFLAYFFLLRAILGKFNLKDLAKGLTRITLAALPMALVCWAGKAFLLQEFLQWGLFLRIFSLGVLCGIAGLTYLGFSYLFKSPEVISLINHLKARILKRS